MPDVQERRIPIVDKINMLKGSDRVSKRPAVVFGSDGIDGAEETVKMLVDIFATEAMFHNLLDHILILRKK